MGIKKKKKHSSQVIPNPWRTQRQGDRTFQEGVLTTEPLGIQQKLLPWQPGVPGLVWWTQEPPQTSCSPAGCTLTMISSTMKADRARIQPQSLAVPLEALSQAFHSTHTSQSSWWAYGVVGCGERGLDSLHLICRYRLDDYFYLNLSSHIWCYDRNIFVNNLRRASEI